VNHGLILITETWPWAGAVEDPFIEPEVPHLLSRFEHFSVMPMRRIGERRDVPSGVHLDLRLAKNLQTILGLTDLHASAGSRNGLLLAAEIIHQVREYRSLRLLRRMAAFAYQATRVSSTIVSHVRERPDARLTIYSYWCTASALGAILARSALPGRCLRIVTRMHGHDLFEDRHRPPVLPFRSYIMSEVDAVVCASQAAVDHLAVRYPEHFDKVSLFRLGVKGAPCLTRRSSSPFVRIVSCSSVVDFKCVERIFETAANLASRNPEWRVEWSHFGGGPRFDLLANSTKHRPANLEVHLPGHMDNASILRWYSEKPADVFVHLSRTEGGVPIAIQEALSFGIPIVAAAAGGVREAVGPDVGELLPITSSPSEVAMAIERTMSRDPISLSAACRMRWHTHFNAAVNHEKFGAFLYSSEQRTKNSGCEVSSSVSSS
jgi:glycosyltransferase involved in cell wall biosynthesis